MSTNQRYFLNSALLHISFVEIGQGQKPSSASTASTPDLKLLSNENAPTKNVPQWLQVRISTVLYYWKLRERTYGPYDGTVKLTEGKTNEENKLFAESLSR